MQDFFQSKLFKGVVLGLAGVTILTFVFSLGVYAGAKRADYSFRWAGAYHRNFGGPQGGFFNDFMGGDFTNANGVFGQLIKIEGQNLTIKGVDNVEKIVTTTAKTTILYQRKNIKILDLKINDNIVAIGEPDNNGQVKAELIRVMPSSLKTPPVNTQQN